jgi:ADP-heptose:LPS heptosyltransferase
VKRIIVVRYGAFGDHIIASSILPHLKAQGWHITMNVNEAGYKVLKNNPHIDAWEHHKTDSVKVEDLPEHWWNLLTSGKYDKMLNLSESIEGTWLPTAGRPGFTWPASVRQKYLNRNYLEFLHDLAEVPYGFDGARFYPTAKERAWAKKTRAKLGDSFVAVWSLSGGAKHKHTPWLDNAMASLFENAPWAKVVLVCGPEGIILEQGWERHPNVLCTSGKWSIRQTFAFLEQADCVVGPETGVLNAAGMLEVPKVCFLSHSSPENLTKHWKNTTTLTAPDTPCHPCHQMHSGWDYCPAVETVNGPAAQCAANITTEMLYRAVVAYADQWKMRNAA